MEWLIAGYCVLLVVVAGLAVAAFAQLRRRERLERAHVELMRIRMKAQRDEMFARYDRKVGR